MSVIYIEHVIRFLAIRPQQKHPTTKEAFYMHANIIWENDCIMPWSKGTMHVMNPSMHYGIAAFEGIRFYHTDRGPAIFRLNEHVARLFYSMNVLGMRSLCPSWHIRDAIIEITRLSGMDEGYIRPIAYFSDEQIGLKNAGGNVGIQIGLFSWEKTAKQSLRVTQSRYMRIHPKTTDPEAKISGHYVNTHLALKDAIASGFDDAILLDYQGNIAEASAANIFAVQKHKIITPERGSILNGVTRQTIIQLLRDNEFTIEEQAITPHTLTSESLEVFLCGTAYEIIPVVQIDDHIIGDGSPGPITRLMTDVYTRIVHGLSGRYKHWLWYAA